MTNHSCKTNQVPQKPGIDSNIIIVGAGLAGLAAAHRLNEKGFTNVTIIEAQERVGGRVHTIDHGKSFVELGAQWLHGADDNPYYQWMADKGLLEDPEPAGLELEGLFCTLNAHIIDKDLVRSVFDIIVKVKHDLSKNCYQELVDRKKFELAQDVFKHQLDDVIRTDENGLGKQRGLVYALFDWFMRYEVIDNCCNSMNEVSISAYTDWSDWGDGTLINFKDGYRSLIEWFVSRIPADQIRKGKIVKKIITHDDKITVKLADFDVRIKCLEEIVDDRDILCDHVIVTSSLGFLKENHNKLFSPSLPLDKVALIDSIGFGTVNKIYLEFEQPFWNSDKGIKIVWTPDDKGKFPDWAYDIIGFDVVRHQPNLLLGWIGGNGAREFEQHSDQSIGKVCLDLIETCLPDTYGRPSKLLNCFCSRWYSNIMVRGSYSFQSMNCYRLKMSSISEPLTDPRDRVTPRIMFAGEATSGNLYSTTHGALASGWREADRLANFHQSKR